MHTEYVYIVLGFSQMKIFYIVFPCLMLRFGGGVCGREEEISRSYFLGEMLPDP